MTPDQADSLAKNEALYRRVNERIESISDAVPPNEQTMDFVCECDRPNCFEKVTAKRTEYEAVRAVATHFIVHHGHVDPKVEHVILSTDRFAVVEKEGEAAREAVALDPRG
jgi:hypothetical protein